MTREDTIVLISPQWIVNQEVKTLEDFRGCSLNLTIVDCKYCDLGWPQYQHAVLISPQWIVNYMRLVATETVINVLISPQWIVNLFAHSVTACAFSVLISPQWIVNSGDYTQISSFGAVLISPQWIVNKNRYTRRLQARQGLNLTIVDCKLTNEPHVFQRI